MNQEILYLATCRTAVASAADHLDSHRIHTARVIQKLDAWRAKSGLSLHLVSNIDSLKTNFAREEKRLTRALKKRLNELEYAEGLTDVR